MKDEINAAILAHSQWKARLESAIETGKSEFNPDDISPDNLCAFGKWLHDLSEEDSKCDNFEEVKKLHADFHKAAGRVLEMALAGKKNEAKEAIGMTSDYSSLSAQLILALGRWKAHCKD